MKPPPHTHTHTHALPSGTCRRLGGSCSSTSRFRRRSITSRVSNACSSPPRASPELSHRVAPWPPVGRRAGQAGGWVGGHMGVEWAGWTRSTGECAPPASPPHADCTQGASHLAPAPAGGCSRWLQTACVWRPAAQGAAYPPGGGGGAAGAWEHPSRLPMRCKQSLACITPPPPTHLAEQVKGAVERGGASEEDGAARGPCDAPHHLGVLGVGGGVGGAQRVALCGAWGAGGGW